MRLSGGAGRLCTLWVTLALSVGCNVTKRPDAEPGGAGHSPAPSVSAAQLSDLTGAKELSPHEPEISHPDVASGLPDETSAPQDCIPTPRQTGQGCNYNGILSVLASAKAQDGSIPDCYRKHVARPREANLAVLVTLTPEGSVGQLNWQKDDLAIPAFTQCLERALVALRFPPPGDVPCQIVVPLTFVPEVRR